MIYTRKYDILINKLWRVDNIIIDFRKESIS